jgi:radical SAM superfamily enzyme YgiQ (UPF0313 family)
MKLTIISVSEPNKYPQIFRKIIHTSNLTLTVLAGITPPDITIQLIDEAVYLKKPNYHKLKTDLAALSVRTSCADRAYAISDLLRQRGIKTVLGGIHPTALPDESINHADAVVIGEAESVWQKVCHDFRNDKLKPFYKGENPPDLKNLPIPRRHLLRFPNRALLNFPTIQTGRGCPNNCTFCSVKKVYGGTYRKRPVEDIIQELRLLWTSKPPNSKFMIPLQDWFLLFLDDNLFANRQYARELLVRLRPFKKKWYSQAPISVAKDKELLKLAKQSGCILLAVGFESVVQESISLVNKTLNHTLLYHDAVKKIHDAGISVAGSFVLGFDEDDASVFEKTLRFAVESGVDLASFHILTPYPGTPFFNQIIKEDRLLKPYGNWQQFDTQHVVFKPKKMKPEELQEGFNWIWREFVSLQSIRKRGRLTPNALFFWPVNLFHNALFNSSMLKMRDSVPT